MCEFVIRGVKIFLGRVIDSIFKITFHWDACKVHCMLSAFALEGIIART